MEAGGGSRPESVRPIGGHEAALRHLAAGGPAVYASGLADAVDRGLVEAGVTAGGRLRVWLTPAGLAAVRGGW